MWLRMPIELAGGYTSGSQRTRVVSEAWGEENLYCPNCPSPALRRAPPNTEAIDFTCPDCENPFQLKSGARPFAARIIDAAYDAMRRAIHQARTPNLLLLHYDAMRWEVQNLLLVPRFVFSMSCIEKRKPLSPAAERRGYVGCFILLGNIPRDARIRVVADGVVSSPHTVREQYARLRPLEKLGYEARGWTLDVLNVVRSLGREDFSLADVYARSAELARLHPRNRFVRPKIRQQLQILRNLGFVEFLGRGRYRVSGPGFWESGMGNRNR